MENHYYIIIAKDITGKLWKTFIIRANTRKGIFCRAVKEMSQADAMKTNEKLSNCVVNCTQ